MTETMESCNVSDMANSIPVLERQNEAALIKAVDKRGGLCIKLSPDGSNGWPDRLILLPGGHVGFVELKAPGRKPRPLQARRMLRLRELGLFVCWTDTTKYIELILDRIDGKITT